MKKIEFNVSLYVIVPVISAGFSLLATILSYNVTLYYLKKGIEPVWPIFFWATLMIVFAAVCGLLIVRTILRPMELFYQKTESMGLLDHMTDNESAGKKSDDMGRYHLLFEQVTEMLSKVESQKLFPQIVGQSNVMRGVFNQIVKVAPTDSTVLIMGETGTGKELVASSIHDHSPRREKPFIAINCAAIPEGLLESELFGHEKGAFTGANARKPGRFEIADGGTIFMDEIGDMPVETQAKLLRVIQEGQFERVGGLSTIKVDIRFVAATNKDLAKMVQAETFREDLFFRLNVFSIHLPPLRDRREDIPLLVERFLENSGKTTQITSECLQLLSLYDWPGNVRELKNAIESATVLAKELIEPAHLPSAINRGWQKGISDEFPVDNTMDDVFEKKLQTFGAWEKLDLPKNGGIDERLQQLEKDLIIAALKKNKGIQVAAAQSLGIKERSLWHRVKKYNIDIADFKPKSA